MREHVRQVWKAGERARASWTKSWLSAAARSPSAGRCACGLCARRPWNCSAPLSPATVAIEFRVEPEAAEAVVLGDPGRLQLVVINLCTNAAQAMEGRGALNLGSMLSS